MIRDFFDILFQCVASIDGSAFWGVLALSLTLGVICWVACSYYTRLWNIHFRVKLKHHVLCAIAAFATVIFTLVFQAVGNLGAIVDEIIDNWSETLVDDNEWLSETYANAFYTMKDEYPREFAGVPEPGKRGSVIPFAKDGMMQMCVTIYVTEACDNFSTLHPFLDKMLSARSGVSEKDIIDDIEAYFRKYNDTYPLHRAVIIAAKHIRECLMEQSPKTVWKTRLILVVMFLFIQLLPFGTIGYCAYKDLKIGKQNYYSNQDISSYDY